MQLEQVCLHCKASLSADARFCDACGAPTSGKEPVEQTKETTGRPAEAERRQLTVMFCDLVGSTALSEQLDPEELRDLLAAYQDICSEVVTRFDGHLAKYLGDGVLVYFGYPQAHEDDAQRAVRAGLGIVAAIKGLGSDVVPRGTTLAVRLGITTGRVVAGDIGSGERVEEKAIVGETPNIAARLQALAEPNTVVIGAATQRLVDGLFNCDDLGPQQLRGISNPVVAYRVREESDAASRFDAWESRGITPLVGREEEVGLLVKRWQQAKDGEGQVVLVSGEAGIGKSRIVRGLQESLESELRNRVLYFCSPYHRNSAFYPVIGQLERGLRFTKDDSVEQKLDKVEAVLGDFNLSVTEFAPVLGSLLSLSTERRYGPPRFSPEELKQKTHEIISSTIQAMAEKDPVLMVVEDAHWIDPSTLELISLLVERLRLARILLFVTFRPEFESPWSGYTHVSALTLNHLSRKDSTEMIAKVTGDKALPDEVRDQIIAETDGVPLFVEELTKTVLESGLLQEAGDRYVLAGPLRPLAIPTSLQDSLMARLDRLGPIKEVAQLAATVGRTFSHELLAAISSLEDSELNDALSQLVETELIYRRGLPPNVTYEFKHALVQDVAYESLLKSVRQQYHQRIAHALELDFPQIAEAEPEILAYHFDTAGLTEQAITYWQRAGELAAQRSANAEAVTHFTRALELLETRPQSPERDRQELQLRVGLGPALLSTKGFSAQEVAETYVRARALCDEVGETSQLFPVTWGLWYTKLHRGQIDEACALADDLLVFAKQQNDTGALLEAHHAAWTGRFAREELHPVLEHAKQGIALYDINEHRSYAFLYGGHDPGVCCRIIGAMCLSLMGFLDQARDLARDGVALAEKLGHPFSLALGLSFSSSVFLFRRETHVVKELADALFDLCDKEGFPHFMAMAKMLQGWTFAVEGQTEKGIALMQEGLDAIRAMRVERLSFQLSILAEAYGWAKDADKALEVLAEASDVIGKTGERRWAPEAYRLKGELLLASAGRDHGEVENCFHRAIELSRRQEAKLFELRAAMSLSRLWHDQGKHNEARALLAPVYDWFTEGFDTADLKEAEALLTALS
jgi:class 3 adenylate cyclase/predicted ATPase